jgi:tungstate transport system ATP-binding protein
MTHLTLGNASVTFNETDVLGPITLDQTISGLVTILGPNGAGKSVFLSLCHGTLRPSSGRVLWDGQDARASRQTRGFMLQTPVVLRRTVAANIAFALQSHAIPRDQHAEKTAAALDLVRLTDKALAPAATLSGGELRRMNLARALVADPTVLLLDEPFAGLDPAATQSIETIILSVARQTPILMANHDLAQTRRIAERVLFFSHGELRENALASAFFSGPKDPQAQTFLKGQLL